MVALEIVLLQWRVIKVVHKVRVWKKILNQFARIAKKDVVLVRVPSRWVTWLVRVFMIKVKCMQVPFDISQKSGIYRWIKISMLSERRGAIVGGQCRSPDVEKIINFPSGHLFASVEKISELEFSSTSVGSPVILRGLMTSRWAQTRWQVGPQMVIRYS